jgi:hypothetical protein
VTIAELIVAVRIGLGSGAVAVCAAADGDGNGIVTIAELMQAVLSALLGCSGRS